MKCCNDNAVTDQSEGHGDHAEAEVRHREVPDEHVPGRPHVGGPEDGRQHQAVARTPHYTQIF